MTTLSKQSYEELIIPFEFLAALPIGGTVATADSYVGVATGVVTGAAALTITGLVATGTRAQAKVAGGTDGEVYKITCKVTDSAGQKLEADGWLAVEDI